MKNFCLIVVIMGCFVGNLSAQGKFGADSADCVTNLSFYRDYAMQEKYKEALPYWRKAISLCPPAASQNLYIDGVKIMKYLITGTKDAKLRSARIDTLMMLYDRRIENFKVNKSSVYKAKAYEVLTYFSDNQEMIFKAFETAVLAGGSKAEPRLMLESMKAASDAYAAKRLPANKFMEFYEKVKGFAVDQAKEKPDDPQTKNLASDLEGLFVASGVASCENMMATYEKEFKASSNDKKVLARLMQMMDINNCTKSSLYYRIVEAYYRLDPSAASAYMVAKIYMLKNDLNNAIKYYKEAIAKQTETVEKSQRMVELGFVYLQNLHDRGQALEQAKQAIKINANNGGAYLLMGSIWAAQECGGDNVISQGAKYWVAVDYITKAKTIDPALTDEANRHINVYAQYYPTQSAAFMYDVVDGNAYTATCNGMTEQTRVRTRK